MADGAHLGVTAGRALQTILGDTPSPKEEEQHSTEAVRDRIMAVPGPCEGEPIWERDLGEEAYSLAADCIAKAMVLAADDKPEILTEVRVYGPQDTEIEDLWGKQMDPTSVAWEEITMRWPGFSDWIGGPTGFQVGFAFNAARMIHELPPAPNPAILEIG